MLAPRRQEPQAQPAPSICGAPLDRMSTRQPGCCPPEHVTCVEHNSVVGPHDPAAHALALDQVLVTANEREFSRIPDLRIENWLR